MAANEQNITDSVKDLDLGKATDKVREIGDRVQSGLRDAAQQARSGMRNANFNESTIPDAFRGAPKLITPRVHRWLDIAVTGYFVVLGAICTSRGRKGPAAAAFINAGMVAGVSALTDYNGDGTKPISFKLHGTLDAVQAATAALGPVLHGFADESEAAFFYGQAANEVAVIASTDWDAGMSPRRQFRAA